VTTRNKHEKTHHSSGDICWMEEVNHTVRASHNYSSNISTSHTKFAA